MTVKSTGPLSITDIQTEFGGTAPISMSEYHADGYYVPVGTTGISSSGAISFHDFYGKSNYFTFQQSASGVRVEHYDQGWDNTGTYIFTASGGYPAYTIDPLNWNTKFRVGMLEIYQTAWFDDGFRIYIAVDGVWNQNAICAIWHPWSDAGWNSGTSFVDYYVPANANVKFGFSAGPCCKDQIHEGTVTVTYHKRTDSYGWSTSYSTALDSPVTVGPLYDGISNYWSRGWWVTDVAGGVWSGVYVNGAVVASDANYYTTSFTVNGNTYYRGEYVTSYDFGYGVTDYFTYYYTTTSKTTFKTTSF